MNYTIKTSFATKVGMQADKSPDRAIGTKPNSLVNICKKAKTVFNESIDTILAKVNASRTEDIPKAKLDGNKPLMLPGALAVSILGKVRFDVKVDNSNSEEVNNKIEDDASQNFVQEDNNAAAKDENSEVQLETEPTADTVDEVEQANTNDDVVSEPEVEAPQESTEENSEITFDGFGSTDNANEETDAVESADNEVKETEATNDDVTSYDQFFAGLDSTDNNEQLPSEEVNQEDVPFESQPTDVVPEEGQVNDVEASEAADVEDNQEVDEEPKQEVNASIAVNSDSLPPLNVDGYQPSVDNNVNQKPSSYNAEEQEVGTAVNELNTITSMLENKNVEKNNLEAQKSSLEQQLQVVTEELEKCNSAIDVLQSEQNEKITQMKDRQAAHSALSDLYSAALQNINLSDDTEKRM